MIEVLVLKYIKESQAQHGLKYDNYQSYRSYCSRRLHRLRRSLNVYQGVASSAKARHQRARKTITITKDMVLEAGEKVPDYAERMLLIQLYLAERAWAYAMQLKQEVADQPRKKYHMQRRFKKAMEIAQQFDYLCHEDIPCSDRTKTESEAYASYITGLYRFERENWAEAKECLNKALNIYVRLNVWCCDHQERIDEIKATLRYCNFNLGGDDAKSRSVDLPSTIKFNDIAYQHALNHYAVTSLASNKIKVVPSPAAKSDRDDDEDDDENWDDACEDL